MYETLEQGGEDASLTWMGKKLAIWEVSTVYPLVFQVATSAIADEEKVEIYRLIYSYIVRRAVCGLTTQNLNKNLTRMVAQLLNNGATLQSFKASFVGQSGPTVRFPDDAEFKQALEISPIYQQFGKPERLKDILWELEQASRTKFQASSLSLPKLNIEHVLPQAWTENWPLRDGRVFPEDKSSGVDNNMRLAILERDSHCHRLGNLTLAPPPLNSSMGKAAFTNKKERLGATLLAINLEFPKRESWDEAAMQARGTVLAQCAIGVWPCILLRYDGRQWKWIRLCSSRHFNMSWRPDSKKHPSVNWHIGKILNCKSDLTRPKGLHSGHTIQWVSLSNRINTAID